MSSFTDKMVRRGMLRRGPAAARDTGEGTPTASTQALGRRREELAKVFAELQWDLGGMAYEMASRDHYRLDVLNRQAAKLQEVDTELAGVERMLSLDEAGAAGSCPTCGALFARGAAFCWQCGHGLIESPANGKSDSS